MPTTRRLLVVALCAVSEAAGAQRGARCADADSPAASQPPLALAGYCPVTLHDRLQWQPGDPATTAIFDGQRYQFAGPRELAIFAARPADYAPALGGDCPVTYAETGRRAAGALQWGLLQGDRLVFCADTEALARLRGDPRRYADADLARDGRCPVTQAEQGRAVPGMAETAVLHGGLRYLFADVPSRAKFVTAPWRYDGSQPAAAKDVELDAQRPPSHGAPMVVRATPGHPAVKRPAAKRRGGEDGDEMMLGALPAMAGYCPVSIARDGAWIRGRYEHRVTLDDLVLLAAGPQEQALLEADPAKYAPACGGDCVVTLAETGQRVRGSVYQALDYEGRLYLFADAKQRDAFKARPERYRDYDVAAGGQCLVTRSDQGREAAGSPQYAAWHRGLIYRFAGAEEKQRFLAAPERYAIGDASDAAGPPANQGPASASP